MHKKECDAIKTSYGKIAFIEREIGECPPYNDNFDQTMNRIVLEEVLFSNDDNIAKELAKIKTYTAVEKALNHSVDVLRHRRINHMDLQYMVPDLFLRLGKNQECYDFVKWYATASREDTDDEESDDDEDIIDQSERYIENTMGLNKNLQRKKTDYWRDMDQPYLDITNANVLELYEKLPEEMVDKIRKELVSSNFVTNEVIMSTGNENTLIKNLESQLEQLYAAVKVSNKYLWPGLLKPEAYIATPVNTNLIYIDKSSYESEQRAISTIKMCHHVWAETPGAIEMIENLSRTN